MSLAPSGRDAPEGWNRSPSLPVRADCVVCIRSGRVGSQKSIDSARSVGLPNRNYEAALLHSRPLTPMWAADKSFRVVGHNHGKKTDFWTPKDFLITLIGGTSQFRISDHKD